MRTLNGFSMKRYSYSILFLFLFIALIWGIGEWVYPSSLPQVRFKEGQEKFNKYCSKCHSLEKEGSGYGPTLYRIADIAANRRPGITDVEYLWESIVDPNAFRAFEGVMPEGLASQIGRDGLFQIVAYLLTIDGKKNFKPVWDIAQGWEPTPGEAITQRSWSLSSLENGKRIFYGKGKCAECHTLNSINASNHLFAPDLSGIGVNDERYLLESINCPSCVLTQGYRFANAVIDDSTYSGRLIESENSITLINRDTIGYTVQEIAKENAEWSLSKTSLMPSYGDAGLDTEEISDLVLFLKSLR